MQTARQVVQIGEASGYTDNGATPFMELIQFIHIFGEDVAQQSEVTARMALADVENQLLGLVKGDIRVFLLVGDGRDLSGGFDETAQNGIALHDAPVILNVAAGWHQINEGGDVAGSSDIFQLVPSL